MVKEIITRKEVEVAAKLAKLELDEEQKDLFYRKLNDFLSYYSKFKELDVTQVEIDIEKTDNRKHFHEDIVKPSLSQSKVLAMTKYRKNGYIQVPRIL